MTNMSDIDSSLSASKSHSYSITSTEAYPEQFQYRRDDGYVATTTITLFATSTATVNTSCTGSSTPVQGAITALGILCGLAILALVILAFYVSRYPPRSVARHLDTREVAHHRRRRNGAHHDLDKDPNISTAAINATRKHKRRHDGRKERYQEPRPSVDPHGIFIPAHRFGGFPENTTYLPTNNPHDPSAVPGFAGQFVAPAFNEDDLMTDASDEDNNPGTGQEAWNTDAEERIRRLKALELARQRATNR